MTDAPNKPKSDGNYAQTFRKDRLPKTKQGLNAAAPDEQVALDEEVEQSFPASDPPTVTRRSTKDQPG